MEGAIEIGAGLGEIGGPLVAIAVGLVALAVLSVVVPFLIGLIVAAIELVAILVLGLVGWLWAWWRKHPRVAILETNGGRWRRELDGGDNIDEDRHMLAAGHGPVALGYEPAE